MLPLLAAGLGVASLGGNIYAARLQANSQEQTNAMNQQMAREQMAFQERMSNTAHQREVQDLRAAGLNPVLSATGGGGASQPSGASATAQAPDEGAYGRAIASSTASALEAASIESSLKKQDAETGKTVAETLNTLEKGKLLSEAVTGQRLSNAKAAKLNPTEIQKAAIETQRAANAKQKEEAETKYRVLRAKEDEENVWWDKKSEQAGQFLDNITSGLNVYKMFQKPKTTPADVKREREAAALRAAYQDRQYDRSR